jgi:glycosyltransferase involved in cell wall biosynthesis
MADAKGVELRVFRNASNHLAYHWQFFVPLGLGTYLRRHARDFDIAHVHGCHHMLGVIAARHLRRTGVPYVLSPHGTAPRIERRRPAKWAFDVTLGRGVTAGAARVVAVSEAERHQLGRLDVPPTSITVVPNPLDLGDFDRPAAAGVFRARFGIAAPRIVMFLGKLTPRKRVDVLIRAVASLGRSDLALVVAGNDMGEGARLRALARRLGIGAVTSFTGLLRGRERLEALTDADVVVYPSRDEVFGLVPLEALLCGRPVIVADDCGSAEIIGLTGGGTIIPEGDAHALATTLAAMLEDATRWRAAARGAQAEVRRLFDPDHIGASLEQVYHEVVAAA